MTGPPQSVIVIWGLLALLALVLIGIFIRHEGRWFAARNKRSSWLVLRICTIPIAAATAFVVIAGSRSVSGPEALLVFFVLLFTVAPLMHFGLHWLIGRFLNPALMIGESAWIAFSGLLIVVGPAALGSAAHPWIHVISRSLGGA